MLGKWGCVSMQDAAALWPHCCCGNASRCCLPAGPLGALLGKWGWVSMQGCWSKAPLLLWRRLAAACLQVLWEETNGDAIITTGVGQHQMWAAQWYKYTEPRRWAPLCFMWP